MRFVMDNAIRTNNAEIVSSLLERHFKIEDYLLTKIINHKQTIDGSFIDNSHIIEACLMNKTIQSRIAPHISQFYSLAKGKPDIAELLERTFPQTVSIINSKAAESLKTRSGARRT